VRGSRRATAAAPSGASVLCAASSELCSKSRRVRAIHVRIHTMPTVPDPHAWTAYDRDLLRALRIQAPRNHLVIRDPRLFWTAIAFLVPGLVMLALWIAYLLWMWD
jgi:hypothetical protein